MRSCIKVLRTMYACLLVSVMSNSLGLGGLLVHQAPLSMQFSRQEYWRGLPFPSPGDLPDSGIEHGLPYCRRILYYLSHQGSPSTSARIQSRAAAAADFQHPLKSSGRRAEMKHSVLREGKSWQDRSSDRYFQKPILRAQFVYLPIARKALKSFVGTNVSRD